MAEGSVIALVASVLRVHHSSQVDLDYRDRNDRIVELGGGQGSRAPSVPQNEKEEGTQKPIALRIDLQFKNLVKAATKGGKRQ